MRSFVCEIETVFERFIFEWEEIKIPTMPFLPHEEKAKKKKVCVKLQCS